MKWWEMMSSKVEKQTQNLGERAKRMPGLTWERFVSVGREDPRRLIHAVKVGISLTLVSLLYLLEPLFKEVGQNAIWAVMTVVVVLEFTAGAITTYMRFFPYIRKHYDYGLVIFMLTFNLITVSSYRVEHILKMAQQRVYTIAIGCAICLLMSLLFFPNWSGEDLHHSTVSKFDGLAKSIEDCVKGYFSDGELEIGKTEALDSEDPIGKSYKAVLDSKSIDENLIISEMSDVEIPFFGNSFSLLYLLEPLFKEAGQNAIWAVMTVVVVLEFTADSSISSLSLQTPVHSPRGRSIKSFEETR
ncbi:unnamed protein product [Cuscuta epithymum]|uniref:Aluminum-activated malate transporter n=1 Tax=Cuscuta epithymum TaxID=186058 RepID=A0AAV0CNG9_9ASTE|nr:unnamed protein product [Cuscuta epithymum]